MLFKIDRDYKDIGYKIHSKTEIEIEPGLTVLVGCNGAGKSTLLEQLKGLVRVAKYPFLYFDNLSEGGAHARSNAGFHDDWNFVARSVTSSEGENIAMNLGRVASRIGSLLHSPEYKDKPYFIFMDAVDSGFSIDNVVALKEQLFNTVFEDCKKSGKEVYIIMTANSYEICRREKCFDVQRCQYVNFKDYEEYRRFIINSRKNKDKKIDAYLKRLEKKEEKSKSRW